MLADVPFSGGFVVARGDVEVFRRAYAAAGGVDTGAANFFPWDVDARGQAAQAGGFGRDHQSSHIAADEAVERDQQHRA